MRNCPIAQVLSILTVVCALVTPSAVNSQSCGSSVCYVTPAGGVTTRNGATWTTALSAADLVSGTRQEVPASNLRRGTTYYLAGGGSYGSIAFDDPESGTTPIRILKGTAANSDSIAGWQSSFAQPAVFNFIVFLTDYYEFNGVERNEAQWNNSASYGFRVMDGFFAHADNFPPGGDYITIKYTSTGLESASAYSSSMSYGVQAWYGRHDWTITHNYFHHGLIPIHFVQNSSSITVDRNYMGPSWGKETIMALYGGSNWVVSNNILEDTCQKTGGAGTDCTTEISGWDNGSAVFNNWQVYGNVIFRKNAKISNHTGAAILGGGAGVANNWRVYNNVIAGFARPASGGLQRAGIIVNGSSDSNNKVYNNIWYVNGNTAAGSDPSASVEVRCDVGGAGSECSHNWCMAGAGSSCTAIGSNSVIGTSNPFANYAAGVFQLIANSTARNAGRSLTGISGFEGGLIDMLGKTRGQDGSWDIGAYEYTAGTDLQPPAAPRTLTVSQ